MLRALAKTLINSGDTISGSGQIGDGTTKMSLTNTSERSRPAAAR